MWDFDYASGTNTWDPVVLFSVKKLSIFDAAFSVWTFQSLTAPFAILFDLAHGDFLLRLRKTGTPPGARLPFIQPSS